MSDDTDWGTGTTDNSPDDVYTDAGAWSDYSAGSAFTCTSPAASEPAPLSPRAAL